MAANEKQSSRFEFPKMLYDMLEEVTDDPKVSPIVSWMPHGRAFKVHKPDDFESNVMPKYFRERYDSFRYLLEQWGFQNLRRGKNRGCYWHIYFVRGNRDAIANATKGYMLSSMPEYLSPRDEPDFYSMPQLDFQKSNKFQTERTTEGSTMTIERKRKRATESTLALSVSAPTSTRNKQSKNMSSKSEPEASPPPRAQDPASAPAPAQTDNKRSLRSNPRRSTSRATSNAPPANKEQNEGSVVSSTHHDDQVSETSQEYKDNPEEEVEEEEEKIKEKVGSSSSSQLRRSTRDRHQAREHSESSPTKSPPNPSEAVEDPKEDSEKAAQKTTDDTLEERSEESAEDSPSKESPIMLQPSKPVFSGFSLPFKKLRLIVMNADTYDGEDPFAVKRRSSAKKA